MSRRTKIITIIVAVIAVVLIAVVAIGAQQGWFKGLADVIGPQGKFRVRVYVQEVQPGTPPIYTDLAGVKTYWRNAIFNSGNQNCGNGNTDLSPYGGNTGGTTSYKEVDGRIYSEIELNYSDFPSGELFIRVDKDPLKSCAYNFVGQGTTGADFEPAVNGHAVKLTAFHVGSVISVRFQTQAGTVTPLPEPGKGAIDGFVYGQNRSGGEDIPVAGVEVTAGAQNGTTDGAGHYIITNLDKNIDYSLRFTPDTCTYQQPDNISVSVGSNSSSENPTRAPNVTLSLGTSAQAGYIWGRVTDYTKTEEPKGVANATVTLQKGTANMAPSPKTTDAEGYYTICPIGTADYTGVYTLFASADGFQTSATETITDLHIPATRNQKKDFVLTPEAAVIGYINIKGTVLDGCTNNAMKYPPLPSVTLKTLDGSTVILQGGQQARGGVDALGQFNFQGVPITETPARYILEANGQMRTSREYIIIQNPSNGQTYDIFDLRLFSSTQKGTLIGQVINAANNQPLQLSQGESLKIVIENLLDGSTQEFSLSDANINITTIDAKHLNTWVKVKAVYTRAEGGQPKEYVGYLSLPNQAPPLPDVVKLGCITTTGVRIPINLVGEPGAGGKTVIVVDQNNQPINGADVTMSEHIEANGAESWNVRATAQTAEVDGQNGIAKFNLDLPYFKFTASKTGFGSTEKICQPGDDCQTVVLMLQQGQDPVNPSSNVVTYSFRFFEGPKDVAENQIDFAKYVAASFDIEFYESFGQNTPFAQQNVLQFLKKKVADFERSKWQILPAGQWATWQEFEAWAKANAGVKTIEWNPAFVPGATANRPVANNTHEYLVRITFNDVAARNQYERTIFNQLQIKFVILGDKRDKITYENVAIDPRMYFPDEADGNRIIIAPLVFRFVVDGGYLSNFKISEKAKKILETAGQYGGNVMPGGQLAGGIVASGTKKVIKFFDRIFSQEAQEGTASLYPGETLIGEYHFDQNGMIGEPNPGAGNYRWELTSFPKYRRDTRADSFTIENSTTSKIVDVNFCYTDNGIYELNDQGLNFKYFGNLDRGYFRLGPSANLAKDTINRAGVNNILYLGDSSAQPNQAAAYLDGSITFCQTTSGQSRDKVVSGKNIVLTNDLLSSIDTTVPGGQKNQVLATKLTELSGYPLYNNLSNTQKTSWNRISRAVDETKNPSQIYNLFIVESKIQKYINTEDVVAFPQSLYSLAVADYKNNGALIQQRISQMAPNSAEQNVAKAIVRFARETAGPNGEADKNLYQPQGRNLSQTIYSIAQIKSGNWLQSNYRNLGASQKISITYTQFVSAIRGNAASNAISQAVASFNSWVDSLLGYANTGIVTGQVLRGGQPVGDVIVTIGNKVAVTNANGNFRITRVPAGAQSINIKDRRTSNILPLSNPNLKVTVVKNQTATVTVRLLSQ